jgi:hypothetical protein
MFVGANLSGMVVQHHSFPRVEPAQVQVVQDPNLWAVGNYVRWEVDEVATFGRISALQRPAAGVEGMATVEVYERGVDEFVPSGEQVQMPLDELTRPLRRWDRIWMLPAIGSLIIMALFGVFFQYREERKPEPAKV